MPIPSKAAGRVAGWLPACIAGCLIVPAIAEDAAAIGEKEKASAIAKFEAAIEKATEQKAEASRDRDRENVKRLSEELRWLRLQLSKAKSQSVEQYAEEAAERARVAEENAKAEAERRKKAADDAARIAAEAKRQREMEREAANRPRKVSHPMPQGVNPVEVVYAAQSAVKSRLKNPAGAKFPGIFSGVDLREHCRYNGDGTYTVTSWVDATNGFGAQLRVAYVATLKKAGDGWVASGVTLIE